MTPQAGHALPDVFTSGTVPSGARDVWSRRLIMALADDLLTLPALVLTAPSRNGKRHALRHENKTRRRCMDWISGIRADLWSPGSGKPGCPTLSSPALLRSFKRGPFARRVRFGKCLKIVMREGSTNRAKIAELLRFNTSKSGDEQISLKECVDHMKGGQDNVYYIISEIIAVMLSWSTPRWTVA